ncbi:MAG: glycoside hydrolase [Flavobacteriales bacterium]|nr:glycoside hydrolase [Flavobacteriales bacterium]
MLKPFFIFLLLVVSYSGFSAEKFKGISFSSPEEQVRLKHISPIQKMNANWIAVVPYGYMKNKKIIYDKDGQWLGERLDGIRKTVKYSKQLGLKVMIKPHVWIGPGKYTGHFKCSTEEEWQAFEKSFRSFIMQLVDLAVEEKVELFCIGAEWGNFVVMRSKFWRQLIKDIRAKYDGKLTYGSNWDDFDQVPFWNQLDYIGIDSYFPISKIENPTIPQLMEGWKVITALLRDFHKKKKKGILFTEFGFRSTINATIDPWDFGSDATYSEEVQSNAFASFFKSLWKEEWFKGGFIWEWYANHESAGGKGDKDYTPQNKLAEKTIRAAFATN